MKSKRVIVLSLGGSLIVPDKIDFVFLEKFKDALRKYYANYKFVIVCGGGSIARKYIDALKHEHKTEKELSLAGIRATRMNARFMMQFFGKEANDTLPMDMKEVESNLQKNDIVICGALRYEERSTSDSTAAKLANYFKSDFINITNVGGLYTANPLTHKNAKFIPCQSWKNFEKRALALNFKAGQHFVLDQQAAVLIREHKIRTYIVGRDLRNLKGILDNKSFKGTIIEG
jgi:uridylate kinase